ncbi:MAG: hypothetical protein ACRDJ1_07695 [Actinomycetota bacterium]
MALALPAAARPTKKEYDATLAPSAGPGQTQTSLTVTISAVPSSQSPVGSANVSIPAGFTGIGSPSISAVPAGKSWTATLSGSTIQLRSAASSQLAPGQSVSVTFTATTPCPEGVYNFGLQVKQSNDFNGQGNDIVSGPPVVGFTVNGGCTPTPTGDHLAFGQQPSDFLAGQEMSPAVTVRVEDASNNLVTDFTGTISLAFGTNPDGSVLFNSGPSTVSGGIATFPNLGVNKPTLGTISGYTLIASSSPALTTATSTPFAITGMSDLCELETCTANTGDLNAGTAADNWIGRVTLDAGECTDTSCYLTAYEVGTCPEGFVCETNLFVFIPPSNQTGLTTVQITCDTTICPNVGPPGAGEPVFKQLDNGDVVELPRCHFSPPAAEDLTYGCISEIIRTRPGDTIFTILLPEGDPAIFK